MKEEIQLFESKKIRTIWNEAEEEWYFSVIDVVAVLTDSPRPRKYWNALKTKLNTEGSEVSQNMGQLKLLSEDGKMRLTDVANTEQILRLIQSVPSKKLNRLNFGWQKWEQNELKKLLIRNCLWSGMTTREYKNFKNLKREN